MAGKKEVQKTVAFRLNLSRADERELYQAIMKHGRNMENDIYGSYGAYVKAALRHYHRQESELELQEQYRQEMRCYLKELAELHDDFSIKKAQWENEKSSVEKLSSLREEIENTNREIAQAQQEYDLNKAAQLQYGKAKSKPYLPFLRDMVIQVFREEAVGRYRPASENTGYKACITRRFFHVLPYPLFGRCR